MSVTNQLRTIDSTCSLLPHPSQFHPIVAPAYTGDSGKGVGLAVESMKRHTTDEGWQLFEGLEYNGYTLYGRGLPNSNTNVREIISNAIGVVVMQDKREWDVQQGNFRDDNARFHCVESLRGRTDLFKLTILKDAHQRQQYHRDSAAEIGCHAWIIYYHPKIIKHLAPYIRPEHLIRTYHSIDPTLVPEFSMRNQGGCLLSGAVSSAYPLRKRLLDWVSYLPQTTVMKHPGYQRDKCYTPDFLKVLSHYKVAICTSSVYGYSLRKIVEATACGCRVVTDLPLDDVLPLIDGNLVRVPANIAPQTMGTLLQQLYDTYDPKVQFAFAQQASEFYNFKASGLRLVQDIENLRASYSSGRGTA